MDNIYKDYIKAARENTEELKRCCEASQNLLRHLEKATFDIIAQTRENAQRQTKGIDNMLKLLNRLEPANEA